MGARILAARVLRPHDRPDGLSSQGWEDSGRVLTSKLRYYEDSGGVGVRTTECESSSSATAIRFG